ncbi:MAG: 50S ribosomal protein L6 [Bacilli bacterium]|jgi:large subunit ribosomal protein L6|nr:50S ribosomal protein L6 [Bacilli bacterium]
MSRIGRRKLIIPDAVTVELSENILTVKSAKGTLNLDIDPLVSVKVEDNAVTTEVIKETPRANVVVGTMNALIKNMLIGVSEGYTKNLEIVGVGYRFNVQGNKIMINAGFSHPVERVCPEGVSVELVNANEISLSGIDKQKVTEFAAKIRDIRSPEPYKGKGIRYKGEHIRRKEGKKAAK